MECHAYDHGRWESYCVQFMIATQNLLKNVADGIPHCAKIVYIAPPCEKDVMLFNYIYIIPAFPVHFRITCPWLLTGQLLLDLYNAKLSQDVYINHGPPLLGKSHRKSTKAQMLKKSIPL